MKKIIFLFLFSASLYSQQIDWLEVHNLSMKGIGELYNVNINKANELFAQVKSMAPGDPRGYFFSCMYYYFKFTLERKHEDFDNFFASSERVISICEGLISQNNKDYTSKFYLAGIYGYRGLMYQIDNSIFKAIWDGKKGFGMLKDIIEEKPDCYDAYLGTGLFDYLLANVPSGYAWILNLLGYGGSKERGIKELKTAEEKGIYTRTEAAIYLAQFLFWEKKYDEAFYYMKKLLAQYPENPLFLNQYANMEALNGKHEYAVDACRKAIEIINRKNITVADEITYLVLANALFNLDDFKGAAENYEIYLKKAPNLSIIQNFNFYRMGLSFDFTGQREKAVKAYSLCKKNDQIDWPDDNLMYEISLEFSKNPPGESFRNLTIANNKFSRKKYDESISAYKTLLRDFSPSEEEKMIAYMNLGSSYFEKNMYVEALDYFNEGLKYRPSLRKHLLPHLYLKKGQTLIKLGRQEEAKISLKKVYEFDDYYFQESIEKNTKEELRKIK
jgi:tetratricopeptide (TPR) repeat protein